MVITSMQYLYTCLRIDILIYSFKRLSNFFKAQTSKVQLHVIKKKNSPKTHACSTLEVFTQQHLLFHSTSKKKKNVEF